MTFESFFVGQNSALIDALNAQDQKLIWITAETGNGKTHLLSSLCNQYDIDKKRIQYLSMNDSDDYSPEIIEGLEGLDLIAIDDIDCVIGQYTWEEKLMVLYESILNSNTRLIMASKKTPKGLSFQIPDLASRFSLGLLFKINPLDDDELVVDDDDNCEDEDDSNTLTKPHLFKFSEPENLQTNHNRAFISIISFLAKVFILEFF